METLSTEKSFGGVQGVYRHASGVTGCGMTFAVYLPLLAFVMSQRRGEKRRTELPTDSQ